MSNDTDTMIAVTVVEFGEPGGLQVQRVAAPDVGEADVVIDVQAAGLNFPDLLMAAGTYQALPERPFVLGMEAAGIVRSVGAEVTDLAPGDRVLAVVSHGAFAERLSAPRHRVYPLPPSLSFAEGGVLGMAFLTALLGLQRRAKVTTGETVLVTGAAGAVGAAAVSVAKALGATVIAATRDVDGLDGSSADVVVSSDPETLRSAVLAATDGRGADVVFDVVGGDVLAQALRSAAWEGRVVIVGFASGDQPVLKPGHLLVKNISVSGLQMTDYLDREPDTISGMIEQLASWHAEGLFALPLARQGGVGEVPGFLDELSTGNLRGRAAMVLRAEERPVGQ